ncbi:MAG: patatin-like phospholipase family protein [Pseudomonadales bacterium]|jgi:NTE family protein|nr:patatin-like phospholipase family protein [Pseudomonadales bacterium]
MSDARLAGRLLLAVTISGVAAFAGAPAMAQCLQPETNRPTIGLVLGGGGARGSAHIGVIRVLEELNIPVDCVAGTSIGSLIGAMYATGMTADELEEVMLGLDWDDLFVDDTQREDQPFRRKRDDNFALYGPKLGLGADSATIRTGVISGQKLSFVFESLVASRVQIDDFDELPIPYRAVSADIVTGEQVVLDRGDLAVAMRASMSVPGVFAPVPWYGHTLVDGGIVNNVPVDVVRDMGADVLIVVNVGSGLLTSDELDSALAIVAQMTNLLIQNNTDDQLETLGAEDVLISPPLGKDVSSGDFAKSAVGIRIGYAAADGARPTLAKLGVSGADYGAHRRNVAGRVTSAPIIDFVRLDNQSRFADEALLTLLDDVPVGEPLDPASLDQQIRGIYALGFMDLVRYEVIEENGGHGIVVHAGQDPRGTKLLEWGADYFGGDNSSAVNLRVGYLDTAIDDFGSEARLLAQLGEDPALYGFLYKYVNPALRLFVVPTLAAERRVLTTFDANGNALQENQVTQFGGSIGIGRELGRSAAVSVGIQAFTGDVEVRTGQPGQPNYDYDGVEYFAKAIYDRLDDRYFPGDGQFLNASFRTSDETLGADDDFDQLSVDGFLAETRGAHSALLGARYNVTTNGAAPIYAQFRAGGFTRLSGLQPGELVGSNFGMVLGGYRYRFGGSGLLPAYAGMTVEYGNVTQDRDDLFERGILGGSAYIGYRSPIGPLYLGVGVAEGDRELVFLRIGNIFGDASIGR